MLAENKTLINVTMIPSDQFILQSTKATRAQKSATALTPKAFSPPEFAGAPVTDAGKVEGVCGDPPVMVAGTEVEVPEGGAVEAIH